MNFRTTKILFVSLLFLGNLFLSQNLVAQIGKSFLDTATLNKLYEQIKYPEISTFRFGYEVVPNFLKKLDTTIFSVKVLGKSLEERNIFSVQCGKGKKKVMLWSQMHGNEPTATAALLDFLHFIDTTKKKNKYVKKILKKLTLHIIPVVNPDGAEAFIRRNALEIDINRDALRLTTPEGKILMETFQQVNPVFAYNLHDQNRFYSVGESGKSSVVTFLAPAYDYSKNSNETRDNAKKLIAGMNELLSQFISGQIAKYNDTFEPRAFGDVFQSMGASTILIESGYLHDDPEKQFIRKLNFFMLLFSLNAIANKEYEDFSIDDYESIPFNSSYKFFDLLVKNVKYKKQNDTFNVDIGVRFSKYPKEGYMMGKKAKISDKGDLSTYFGHENLSGNGLFIEAGKFFQGKIKKDSAFVDSLLTLGYTNISCEKGVSLPPFECNGKKYENEILLKNKANFYLRNEENEVFFVVINGKVYHIKP